MAFQRLLRTSLYLSYRLSTEGKPDTYYPRPLLPDVTSRTLTNFRADFILTLRLLIRQTVDHETDQRDDEQ